MIQNLKIENFRSIQNAEIPLTRINVLTGANNSGKSSVIYAMMVYKNFMENPNRTLDQILTPSTINLGPFKEVVFDKVEKQQIGLGIKSSVVHVQTKIEIQYEHKLTLNPVGSSIFTKSFAPEIFQARMDIPLPYPMNKQEEFMIKTNGGNVKVLWNGITGSSTYDGKLPENLDALQIEATVQGAFVGASVNLQGFSFSPLERGFKRPFYGTVPITNNTPYTEDEIATVIANDSDLAGKIAHYLEKIVERHFSVAITLGTSNFRLQTRDKKTGFTTDLVNEGLGTNQLVTLLAKILDKNSTTVFIDEPENHLHPSVIDKLIETIIEISITENKQFIFSTHSEHMIHSLLNSVKNKKLEAKSLNIFYVTKKGKASEFELQPVNEKGQIEGGLKSFYEEELKDLKQFFKID